MNNEDLVTDIKDIVTIRFISRAPGNDWETGSHDVAPSGRRPIIVPKGATYYLDVLNNRGDVVLSNARYQVGSGLTHDKAGREVAPDALGIMHSFWIDASGADEPFDDWCLDLGYDTDSRKALETYLACQTTYAALRKGLTADERELIAGFVEDL